MSQAYNFSMFQSHNVTRQEPVVPGQIGKTYKVDGYTVTQFFRISQPAVENIPERKKYDLRILDAFCGTTV